MMKKWVLSVGLVIGMAIFTYSCSNTGSATTPDAADGIASDTDNDIHDRDIAPDAGDDMADRGATSDAGDDMADRGAASDAGDDMADRGAASDAGDDMADQGATPDAGDDMADQGATSDASDDMADQGATPDAGDEMADDGSSQVQDDGSSQVQDDSQVEYDDCPDAPGGPLEHGQSRLLWNDDYSPNCDSQERVCFDGQLLGDPSYVYTECKYCPWSSAPAQKLVFFTLGDDANPGDETRDYTIEDQVVDFIEGTPAGQTLRVAMYSFSRNRVATALIEAQQRGVDVRVVVDDVSQGYSAVENLIDGIGSDRVTICIDSCMGLRINHNKFMTASGLCDGSTKAVLQSSANFSNPQLWHDNNAVIIRDDQALYSAYFQYWQDLQLQQQNLNYYDGPNGVTLGDTGTKVYFFPRSGGDPEPSEDTIYSILNNIVCTQDTTIRIAMAFWSGPRQYLVDKLETMAATCDVRILIDDDNSTIISYLASRPRLKYRYKVLPFIHHKYLLVDAPNYSGSHKRYVWTGSHNYTYGALRENDETLLRINNNTVFDAFLDNWNSMNSR